MELSNTVLGDERHTLVEAVVRDRLEALAAVEEVLPAERDHLRGVQQLVHEGT